MADVPEGCLGRIPDGRQASAEFCGEYCRNRHWREQHPRKPAGKKRGRTIQERFEAWREENAATWQLIRRFAYRALDSGRSGFGMAAIVERVRWEVEIETPEGEPFKINNDFRSRMTRELIKEDSRFERLFETRELKAK